MRLLAAVALMGCITTHLASPANAGMIGDTVTMHYETPTLNSGYYDGGSAVVGAGVEFTGLNVGLWANADFTNTQLILSFTFSHTWSPATHNGPVFVDTAHPFTSVSINPATTSAWFNAGMVSISGNSLIVNWQGQSFTNGQNIVLDLTTSEVPEPATLALMTVGLAGMGVLRRRRRG
jgi:hypothetical protein